MTRHERTLIPLHALAARSACAKMTAPHLKAPQASVEQAGCLSAEFEWERKAAAYVEIFNLLADISGDPVLARRLSDTTGYVHHLVASAGPGADGTIMGSRRRLLARMRAGDAEGAALEIEEHLRTLAAVAVRPAPQRAGRSGPDLR